VAPQYLPFPFDESAFDHVSTGFFEACQRHEFTVQRCKDCGNFQHPPRAVCTSCHSFDLEWAGVSGRGTVFTYTVVHHGPGMLSEYVPFNIVSVELEGTNGTRVVSNLIDVAPDQIKIDMPVEVTWEEAINGTVVPRFRAS
jgi:uncharacterized protein